MLLIISHIYSFCIHSPVSSILIGSLSVTEVSIGHKVHHQQFPFSFLGNLQSSSTKRWRFDLCVRYLLFNFVVVMLSVQDTSKLYCVTCATKEDDTLR